MFQTILRRLFFTLTLIEPSKSNVLIPEASHIYSRIAEGTFDTHRGRTHSLVIFFDRHKVPPWSMHA